MCEQGAQILRLSEGAPSSSTKIPEKDGSLHLVTRRRATAVHWVASLEVATQRAVERASGGE